MNHVIINMAIVTFVVMTLLVHFEVDKEVANLILASLSAVGIAVVGILSPSSKTKRDSD